MINCGTAGSTLGLAAMLVLASAQAQPAPPEAHKPAAAGLKLLAAAFATSDVDRATAFYTNGLGLTAAARMKNGNSIEIPLCSRAAVQF